MTEEKPDSNSKMEIGKRSWALRELVRELSSRNFWVAMSSILGGVAIVVTAGVFVGEFVEERVNKRVDKLMLPYQHLFSAINAGRNDDYWGTAIELKQTLDSLFLKNIVCLLT